MPGSPNAFTVFSSVLRELRTLDPETRARVIDAIESELSYTPTAISMKDIHPAGGRFIVRPEVAPLQGWGDEIETPVAKVPDLLTIKQAAKVAGVSGAAMNSAIARGSVPTDKSTGKRKVFRDAAIAYKAQRLAWAKKQKK